MTTTIDTRGTIDVPRPGRVGQGTAVEQSRAVAEVQAAIVVAQQVPRNITRAVGDAQRSCAQRSLAERAFFRYNRGGNQISGASVQLARELARCWGNIQYGVTELRRDDTYGQSEMQAWAWDVQTNARSSTTFIVPHRRDTRDGSKDLTDQRDIYENNANNGARRLREMIFAILPGWYTEDAIAACYETLNGDEAKDGTIAERADKAVKLFAPLKVTLAQLEQKLGAPRARWTAADLAQLHIVYRSLVRGEATREDEFGADPGRVTAADITGAAVEGPAAPSSTPGPGRAAARETDASAAGTGGKGPGGAGEPPPDQRQADEGTGGPGDTKPRFRRLTKPTLGRLKGALFSVPLGNSQDTLDAVSALAGRKVQMVEALSQDEGDAVLAAIDGALTDAGGDKEAAGAALLERATAWLTAQAQDDDAEQVPGED